MATPDRITAIETRLLRLATFIILSGPNEFHEIIDADSLRQAYAKAVERSRCSGVDITDPDLLHDTTWAVEYDPDVARDLGLLDLEERDHRLALWRAEAPWR